MALAEIANWLGLVIVNTVDIFDPEMVVVGGGLGNLGELLLGPARELLKEALPPGRDQTRLVSAALGADVGLWARAGSLGEVCGLLQPPPSTRPSGVRTGAVSMIAGDDTRATNL